MSYESLKLKNRCVIDWFEFTYHSKNPETLFIDFCKCFPEFEKDISSCGLKLEKGLLNYSVVYDISGAYKIMWHPDRPHMGVHVRFSGSSIPLLCGIFKLKSDYLGFVAAKSLFDLFYQRISERGDRIKWSRIDVAYDDFTRSYSPADYIRLQFDNRIRSKCKQSRMAFSALQEPDRGSTWYLGSRSGNNHNVRFLRVYDKNYESRGKINAIRYELELRGSYASAVIDEIRNNGSTLLFGDILQDMFVVLDDLPFKGTSRNAVAVAKSRASVNQKWLTLFETQVSRRVKVVLPGYVSIDDFSRLSNYLTNVRRPLRFYLDTFGVYKLLELVNSYNYKPKDLEVLRKIRSEAFYEYSM